MLVIVAALILVLAASSAFLWFVCRRAPDGYENDSGFHVTAGIEPSAKPVVRKALKPHHDHEPIAA